MKRLLYLFFSFCLLGLIVAGCNENKLKTVRGEVVELDILHDTIISNLILSVDGDSLLFNLKDAQFVNGDVFSGDSVEIDYVSTKSDTLRALLVSLINKSAHVLIPSQMSNDSLVTLPVETLKRATEPSDSTNSRIE